MRVVTLEAICLMALQAADDPHALPVLGDMILELGWRDQRVGVLVQYGFFPGVTRRSKERPLPSRAALDGMASKPTQRFARAVAAVLLFESWSLRRWKGVESSYVSVAGIVARRFATLSELCEAQLIDAGQFQRLLEAPEADGGGTSPMTP